MGWVITHGADNQRIVPLLVSIDFGAPIYMTNYGSPVVTDGAHGAIAARWEPGGVKDDGFALSQGQVTSPVSLTFDNADLYWSARLYGGDIPGGVIRIYAAWLDPSAHTTVSKEEVCLFGPGYVESVTNLDRTSATLSLSPRLDLSEIVAPRRLGSHNCTALYKGIACGYKGTLAGCERTHDACIAHSNQYRFGGTLTTWLPPDAELRAANG
jgi:hypothetical protein